MKFTNYRGKMLKINYFIIFFFATIADLIAATSYNLAANATLSVNELSVCKNLVSTSTFNYIVPTGTASDWAAFLAHLPAGIISTDCLVHGSITYTCSGGLVNIPTGATQVQFTAHGGDGGGAPYVQGPESGGGGGGVVILDGASHLLVYLGGGGGGNGGAGGTGGTFTTLATGGKVLPGYGIPNGGDGTWGGKGGNGVIMYNSGGPGGNPGFGGGANGATFPSQAVATGPDGVSGTDSGGGGGAGLFVGVAGTNPTRTTVVNGISYGGGRGGTGASGGAGGGVGSAGGGAGYGGGGGAYKAEGAGGAGSSYIDPTFPTTGNLTVAASGVSFYVYAGCGGAATGSHYLPPSASSAGQPGVVTVSW
jgi:hypothetical protein